MEQAHTGPLDESPRTSLVDVANSVEQEAEIRALVEQLVFAEGEANNQPMRNPGIKIYRADGTEAKPDGDAKKDDDYRKRFESCELAFRKLYDLKITAFPILIEHLDDKRQSINFRNHSLGNSVGKACYWNIYYQLQDIPQNYSSYGHGRTGRDGKSHPKPYWEATPFDEVGGLKEWLDRNKKLSYAEMRIQCLRWLLEKEKTIGACDAESYFENILPLDIRILERRRQAGEIVERELTKLRAAMEKKDASIIPAELLPEKK